MPKSEHDQFCQFMAEEEKDTYRNDQSDIHADDLEETLLI